MTCRPIPTWDDLPDELREREGPFIASGVDRDTGERFDALVAQAFDHNLTAPEVAELARHANAHVTLTMYAGLTGDRRA